MGEKECLCGLAAIAMKRYVDELHKAILEPDFFTESEKILMSQGFGLGPVGKLSKEAWVVITLLTGKEKEEIEKLPRIPDVIGGPSLRNVVSAIEDSCGIDLSVEERRLNYAAQEFAKGADQFYFLKEENKFTDEVFNKLAECGGTKPAPTFSDILEKGRRIRGEE